MKEVITENDTNILSTLRQPAASILPVDRAIEKPYSMRR
jgi:hypothetical protein